MDISTQTEYQANSLGYFLEDIERPVQIARQTYIPQLLKDLLCPETIFLDRFGIGSHELEELHDILEAKLLRYQTIIPENLLTKNCVALTLRFLASGLTMQELGRQYNISYLKILRIIRIVTKTMANHLVPIVMPTPSEHMWEKTAEEFRNKYNMPNCIGAIEGKNLFVNGKKIVFLAIVDAHHRFIMVDLGYYRKNLFRGDVMANSIIGKLFMKNLFRVPESKSITEDTEPVPFMILGSSLFPAKPYLMTKYSRPECANNELNRVFNTRISRAKLTVNRALLHLRHRWRVFQGPLPVPSYLVERIVVSCCCLQNFFALRDTDSITPEPPDSYAILSNEKLDSLKRLLPEDSRDVRTKFKKYFLSQEGQVPWQWQDIL